MQGQFSPDGRLVAYSSDESGRFEVYVRPYPPGPNKWKVSLNGGHRPRWRRDGKELFFLTPEGKLAAASVKAVTSAGPRPVFESAAPQEMFNAGVRGYVSSTAFFVYSVSADGKRFLVNTAEAAAADTPLTVVVNWRKAVASDK